MSDNDTRTAIERAGEAARHRFNYLPWKTAAIATGAFEEGFLARDAEQNAKLEAVLALHKPGRHVVAPIWGDGRYCLECNNWAETEPVYEWPCATVRAIKAAS